jgi:hypothetical protein
VATNYEVKKLWRKKNPKARNAERKKYYARFRDSGTNAGSEWTERELEMIMAPDRPFDRDLAALIGRSVQAIQIMRSRCRKLDADQVQRSASQKGTP